MLIYHYNFTGLCIYILINYCKLFYISSQNKLFNLFFFAVNFAEYQTAVQTFFSMHVHLRFILYLAHGLSSAYFVCIRNASIETFKYIKNREK